MARGRAETAGLCAVVLVYLFLSLLCWNHVEEDAFVYFRQAALIADGYGYVFNRGGLPVEAGSSALWLLMLVLLEYASVDMLTGAKLAGFALGVGSLVLTHRLAKGFVADPVLRLLPAALLAVSTPFVMNNQRGLETPLFALLVLCLCFCCTERRFFRLWWVPASLLLAARPEGFFVLLALLPVFWMRRQEWRAIAPGVLCVAGAALALLTLRFWYFHDLVPNPFYIKMRLEGWLGATRVHWLFFGNLIYFFSLPLLLTLRDRSFWNEGRRVLAGFVAVQVVWTVLAKDYMPYYRHMLPALPFVYVLVASGLERLVARGDGAPAAWRRGAAALVAAGCVVTTLLSTQSVGYFQRDFKNPVRSALFGFAAAPGAYARAILGKMREPLAPNALDEKMKGTATIGSTYQCLVGEFLRRNYPGPVTVVYDQMGQTPFYAGLDKRFVDGWGLTDRTVAAYYFRRHLEEEPTVAFGLYARLLAGLRALLLSDEARARLPKAGTAAEALDYLFGVDADLVLINSFLVADAPDSLPARMREDPRLERGYRHVARLAGFVDVYERLGRPVRGGPFHAPRGLAVE